MSIGTETTDLSPAPAKPSTRDCADGSSPVPPEGEARARQTASRTLADLAHQSEEPLVSQEYGLSLVHLLKMPEVKVDWVIPRMLARQNLMLLAGEPKRACKSWLLLNLAWDLAEQKPLWSVTHSRQGPLFVPPRPMRTLYFSQEDTYADAKLRVEAVCRAGREASRNVIIYPKDPAVVIDNDDGLKRIQEIINNNAPIDLIIFDPYRNIYSGDENSSDVNAANIRQLSHLQREFNCSIILAHHENKPPKERGSYERSSPYAMRGTTALYGSADSVVMVLPKNARGNSPDTHNLRLYFTTKRSGQISPAKLKVNSEIGEVQFEGFAVGRPGDSGENAD